jgi:hypothetical protein
MRVSERRGPSDRWLRSIRLAVWLVLWSAVTMPLTTGCQGRADPLTVERQTLVPGVRGSPHAIARMAAGDFVVAGGRFTAWVFAVSSDGRLLWKYEEAHDTRISVPYQSEFHSVLTLDNGNLLACGETELGNGGGLIIILDPSGRVVERQSLFPNDDRKYFSSGFNECLRWNGSIFLLGRATDGTHGPNWFMRLDNNGHKEWEALTTEVPAAHAVEVENHDLVLAGFDPGGTTYVVRVNQKFEILARRTIKSSAYALLRSVGPPRNTSRLIIYTLDGKTTLYTLNERLEDEEAPRPLVAMDVERGCGYALADGSLALFGTVIADGVATAAVAHLDRNKAAAGRVLEHKENVSTSSTTIGDAIPLSATRFIAVRERNSTNASEAGVMLSWVSFE